MSYPRIHLLGLPIDALTREQAVDQLCLLVSGKGQHHVMTPNAEMLVESTRNPQFRAILERSRLNLPDSVGLLHAAKWTGQELPERVTGVDTVIDLCKELSGEHPVFLLGAAPGVAEKAAQILQRRNPDLVIAGTHPGSPSDADAPSIIAKINAAKPQLLLVAFGAPAQDLWISKYLSSLPTVHVAMGVGGTFDFIAGVQKRAPAIFQAMGLEWLWRVMREPRRIGRIWRAVVVFPWLVWRYGKDSKLKIDN